MTEIETSKTTARGWRNRAVCRDVDPELFFPAAESGPIRDAQVTAAKAVCAGCPVRRECLAEALARIPYGIAGGLTEHERGRLRRRTGTPGCGVVAAVDEVLTDGPPPGMTRRERAGVGRVLLAAGRSVRQVAGDCGVCPRTVQRWAVDPANTGVSTTRTDVGEGSRGGNRAPLQIFRAHDTQAGTRAPEGHRA